MEHEFSTKLRTEVEVKVRPSVTRRTMRIET